MEYPVLYSYLETPFQQQVSHSVGILIELSEGPPLPSPLENQRCFVPVAFHCFSKDLRNSVLLTEVASDIHLHPQQHTCRTTVERVNIIKSGKQTTHYQLILE